MFFRLLSRFPVGFAGLFLWISVFVGLVIKYEIRREFAALVASVAVYLSVVAFRKFWDRLEEGRLVRYYETIWENRYVVSRHPRTGEEFDLPEELEELVVWTDYEDVIGTVQEEKDWLVKSDNRWATKPGIDEKARISVLGFIFQDAEAINENWESEFPARVIREIQEDRAKRHRRLKKYDADWYNLHGNRQRGVSWSAQ